MFFVKTVLQGIGESLILRYKNEAAAATAYEKLEAHRSWNAAGPASPPMLEVTDDFGLRVRVPPYTVLLVQFIDVDKAIEAECHYVLDQQKIGGRMAKMAQSHSPIIAPGMSNGHLRA